MSQLQLTTLAKVKTSLGIIDATKDSLITQTIIGISAVIERYCGRNFKSQNYAEIRDGKGKSKIFLNNYPVTALASIEYRSGTPTTILWNVYSADGYLLYEKAGYVSFFGRISGVSQGYRINYTAGYLIDFTNETNIGQHTLPADITQVVTELVSQSVNTSASQGISSMTTEGQTVSFDIGNKNLGSMQKNIINSYKVNRV